MSSFLSCLALEIKCHPFYFGVFWLTSWGQQSLSSLWHFPRLDDVKFQVNQCRLIWVFFFHFSLLWCHCFNFCLSPLTKIINLWIKVRCLCKWPEDKFACSMKKQLINWLSALFNSFSFFWKSIVKNSFFPIK